MNLMLNRLDPDVPDPVESRRRAAGRLVRLAYATAVFGILAFFIVYFGRPLVYLSGPGIVTSPLAVVSLPYVAQVKHINVTRGSKVKAGEEIGQIWSPEQENVVANYMRSLVDITGRSAELRIKARVASDSLDAARAYLLLTEDAVERLDASAFASLNFRVDMLRERASARKTVVTQEAEAAEATAQLASLDELGRQIREQLDVVRRNFMDGRVFATIDGIVATRPAPIGQSLVAGAPLAEILDTRDVFVNWYIPNERLVDPEVGNEVAVLFGNWRFYGTIAEILPVSDVFGGAQAPITRERIATQIARIRFSPGTEPPALNSTVYIRMYYTDVAARVAALLVRFFGLRGV